MAYSFLEPVKVGPFTLRNRIIKPAMAEYICHDDGTVSDQFIAFYRNIAKGGAALIVPGISVLDETETTPPTFQGARNPHLTDKKYLPGLRKAVSAVHEEGALIMFQLWQSGSVVTEAGLKSKINDFTLEELAELKGKFVKAAGLVKESGADGVEFHMAHTYLASQMLSPYFNWRTDQYGADTIENATRFARECIEEITKKYCDDRFTLIVKLNADDFTDGGITPGWAGQAAAILEKAGAQMFTVNAGGALVGYNYMSDNGHQPEGWKVHLAETVKQYVSVPVAASGNIRHPDYVHQLIRDKRCDIVAMGRTLLADPDWVRKCEEGREDELRYCISCLYCFTPVPEDDSIPGCSVNPYCKCERSKPEPRRDGAGRTVAVIGAGPAGLEAAVVLGERGFHPILLERRPYLGGLVALAAVPPHKRKLQWLIDYYARQLRRLDVDVRLSTEATVELLKELKPYAVFVAAGSQEMIPAKIPGIGQSHVYTARAILEGRVRLTHQNIVVIGGGLTGVETAHLLSLKGNRVKVLELLPEKKLSIADSLSHADARRDGVELLYEHSLAEVKEQSVVVKAVHGEETFEIPADAVVLAMGIVQDRLFCDTVKAIFPNTVLIGDCSTPGRIPTSIRSGAEAAYRLQ